MTFRTPVGCSNHRATGSLVVSEVIFTEFVVTRVLHTASYRINNAESSVCDNEERKMGNFQARKKVRKIEYSVVTSVGQIYGIFSCHERLPPPPPTLVTTEYFIFLSPSFLLYYADVVYK